MAKPEAVLLNVDDNEPARYSRTRLLRAADFEVYEAGTGAAVLDLVRSVCPDIVLLDVNLPDISGIEVCRSIKASPDAASALVLQISASSISAPQATEALNSGADCYIIEPVDPEVLIATVRALLRIRRAERDLAGANEALLRTNLRLKEVNEALRRSNDDLEHFAYVASHDLREPLRTVTTHVQLLERLLDQKLDAQGHELVRFIVDGTHRMSALIDGILIYSRAGLSVQDFNAVSLDDALSWALRNLKESLESTRCQVTYGELPTVRGDAVQIAQLFQNLIGNAVKYHSTSETPHVWIDAHRSQGYWVISVRDNGIGIASKFHEKIFTPFKRLHGGEIPGTGIGLALCRRIIEVHGGKIWVESEEGNGATFFFTLLPLDPESAGRDGSHTKTTAPPPNR